MDEYTQEELGMNQAKARKFEVNLVRLAARLTDKAYKSENNKAMLKNELGVDDKLIEKLRDSARNFGKGFWIP